MTFSNKDYYSIEKNKHDVVAKAFRW